MGGGDPPTHPTRVHGSARSIFSDHPQHYRPTLKCPLQATLAMELWLGLGGYSQKGKQTGQPRGWAA